MSFSDCFSSCLSPLPTPGQLADSLSDLVEFLEKLHSAAESSGLGEEAAIPALIAAGALTGIDEAAVAALGAAGAITVGAYIATCGSCAVGCAGSSIWSAITASNDSYVKNALTVAANDANVPQETVA